MARTQQDYDDIPGTFVFDAERSREGFGGNIYFTAKLGATDGHSFQQLAAVMTGSSQQDYAAMMLAGGRSVEGNRSRSGKSLTGKSPARKSKPNTKSKSKISAMRK